MPDPIAHARVLDVLKFRADRVGIDAFEERDHLAQRHLAAIEKKFRRDLKIEVLLAETKLAQTQERICRALFRQWIEPRDRMAERAVSVDESVDPRLERALADLARRMRDGLGGAIAQIQIAQFEAFEERRPPGIDRFGIVLPTPVILLEKIEVDAGGERGTHGGSICKASAGTAS